ncbi:hypothetical protein AX769_02405 [Frondihabitans sp. PAMC 28766]|uniref:hypothetical protein n=1 Tax=Frondihabitans sp. PAMC 28766 TaxID=1795630 RepID=UPI00078EC787|nr:hypothetical protein [Frondihabitans sp. PAMC 28766]AMM19192.1 hypothetical protein AX769_02405 [Frondihabitans sp. PAMC 28766]
MTPIPLRPLLAAAATALIILLGGGRTDAAALASASPVATTPPSNVRATTSGTTTTFSATATPGSTLTLWNFKGTRLASGIRVSPEGAWEGTRSNMRTSVWKLLFIQNEGKSTSTP